MARSGISALAILSVFVLVVSVIGRYEACRLLDEEAMLAKNAKIIFDNLHLQSLQKNTGKTPGKNGCSYSPGNPTRCINNSQNFAGKRTTALPPSLPRQAYPQVGLLDCRASGRLGYVRVLSDLDRKNVLDSGCLDGGDVATCPGLIKVNAEYVRVLSDPERRNVLDPGDLDGGDAATCPGILCLGPGPLQLGLTYYGLSFAPHSLMRVYPDGGVE
ncbi:hypothetical protein AgCh_034755 [Apium graveolens]